jgi:putative ABC transport system ATP-binding protein
LRFQFAELKVHDVSTIVELNDVAHEYALGELRVPALRQVNFSLKSGEFVVVIGPSGSGKSTLLNVMGCVDVPSHGTVRSGGRLTFSLTDEELTRLRREKIGFVFQHFNLMPALSVARNVELPLMLRSDVSRIERRQRLAEALEGVGLSSHARHRPAELSGGQRQRVAIARALVHRPELVIADEPTANLDTATGEKILSLMHELKRKEGTSFVVATHDPRVIHHAERVITLEDGRIVSDTARAEQ